MTSATASHLSRGARDGRARGSRDALEPRAARGRSRSRLSFALYLAGGTLASLLFLLPLAWAVARSLMPDSLVTQAPRRATSGT